MVDVGAKAPTARRAVAEAEVAVSPETLSLVIDGADPRPQARRPVPADGDTTPMDCRRRGNETLTFQIRLGWKD